jgi:putative tryptophan/tyrosine transport system substrate-binding protein
VRRREFVKLVGAGLLGSPIAAYAQQPSLPVIGFLGARSASDATHLTAAFHQGLKETGYVVGQNVAIEYRWAEGHYDQLPSLANDLARRQVAVIVAGGTGAAFAAKAATTTLPIVIAVGADPVKLGLVAELGRPGSNVTGVSFLANTIGAKLFEVLHETVPYAKAFGYLVNPNNPNAELDVKDIQTAADLLHQKILIVKAYTENELESAFATMIAQQVGAVAVEADPFFNGHSDKLAELAAREGLPAIFPFRDYVEAGGLMSYGASLTEAFHLVGVYTARILKGEKPADLPVQQSTKVEFVINLKAAKALSLTIPLTLLGRADEMIE